MKKVIVALTLILIFIIQSCNFVGKSDAVCQSDTLNIYYNEYTDWVCKEATITYEENKARALVYMKYKGNTYVSLNKSVSLEFSIKYPERKKVVLQITDTGCYIVKVLY